MIQNGIQNGTLAKSFLSVLILSLVLGCGQKGNNTAGLVINLRPTQTYLLPGSTSTCLDYQAYKVALLAARAGGTSTAPALSTSASSLWVTFPAFTLEWDFDITLTVAYMVFTISSPQFSGGTFTYTISGTELSALLGRASNSFIGQKDMLNSIGITDPNSPATKMIVSNDPARDCGPTKVNDILGGTCVNFPKIYSPTYTSCGIQIGGISIANKNANQFTAPFTLKLIGYSTDSKFTVTPVQSEVDGQVTYAGFQ